VRLAKVQAPQSVQPSFDVDKGEAEAIHLALEIKATAILMDDRRGRITAMRCGLAVIGMLGVLESAAQRELIDLPGAIMKLQQTNTRIDPELIQAALERHQARRNERD
jgi:predicted nucleic acid-binding protein